MMIVPRLFACLLALVLTWGVAHPVAAAPRKPVHRAAVATDWRRVVVATPEGGMRIGNPAAKVKLVEYASFTCPHCAAFSGEGWVPLRDRYVRSGKLSYELRIALRDRADTTAALTARCTGPSHYFAAAEAIFAAQPSWEQRAIDWDQQHPADFDGPGAPAAFAALAENSGLAAIGRAQGVPAGQAARCYADQQALKALAHTAEDAWNVRKIGGTPAFYIGAEKLDSVFGWASLEPRLRAAIGG